MNNLRKIISDTCENQKAKCAKKISGKCNNNRCEYSGVYIDDLFVCKRCKCFTCRYCIKLDREKCAKCEYELTINKAIFNCEHCGCGIETAMCNNCGNLLRLCDGDCYWNDEPHWDENCVNSRCRMCRKN